MVTTTGLHYQVKITEPWTHHVKVSLKGERSEDQDKLRFFLPVWSPGSYMVREYGRHVRRLQVLQGNGEFLYFEKISKNEWEVDWSKSDLKTAQNSFTVQYEVYCNEVSVRTSHVNLTHAFLHGPSLFMGITGREEERVELEVEFPPCWSKLSTGLRDISPKREQFLYAANNYDELLDSPIEIGCHETSGFRVDGKDHHLAFLNLPTNIFGDLEKDIQSITEKVANFWGETPYDSYQYITHFFPKTFGGLEHHNSTALQFDPLEVGHEEGYFDFLGLVAHEYFHTWNVKRIRPVELGPFNYHEENYTRMHWLTEGMTSFVDDLFVLNCDISSESYFLKSLTKKMNAYLKTPGRFFDSLEDASFDAWIKLYRPHENSKNATVSYYLKGALVFFCLNSLLDLQGHTLRDFSAALWNRYKADPNKGMSKDEVLKMIYSMTGIAIGEEFESFISDTGELPLEESCVRSGIEIHWHRPTGLDWGCDLKNRGENVFIENIRLDGPAFKCGLNHGDEIIACGGQRLQATSLAPWQKTLKKGQPLELLISRQGSLLTIDVSPEEMPREIEKLTIKDPKAFKRVMKSL